MVDVMESSILNRASYIPMTHRHRSIAVVLVMLVYAILGLIILNWRQPLPAERAHEPIAVFQLQSPPKTLPSPIQAEPDRPIDAAAPAAASPRPSGSPMVGVDTPPAALTVSPSEVSHVDITPAPAALPMPPTDAGGVVARDAFGTADGETGGNGGRGNGAGSGDGSGGGNGGNGGGGGVATKAKWAREVSWEQIYAVHPARAKSANVSGKAMLTCQAARNGKLHHCTVVSESAGGWSFGRAALRLVPDLRVVPRKENGVVIDNGQVYFTIRFDMPIVLPKGPPSAKN